MPVWFQGGIQPVDNFIDLFLAVGAALERAVGNFFIFFRVDVAKGQVFQFPFDLPDAQPVGQRGENIQGFLGDALALIFRHVPERAHVVQPVGQLNQHDADILAHGEKGLAQGLLGEQFSARVIDDFEGLVGVQPVFGDLRIMLVAAGYARQMGQLGDAIDQAGNFLAKLTPDILQGDLGVFDRIVEQAGGDDGWGNFQLGQNGGHGDAVGDVWFAAGPLLPGVGCFREMVRPQDQLLIAVV